MSTVKNTAYKTILFTRSDGTYATVLVNLDDPFDLNENFLVLQIENVNTPKELRLFSWINNKRWTLNEFNFFALNNDLCLRVLDKTNNVIVSYGNCGSLVQRVFGFPFGINFN
jgi:hypothetical protein